MKKLFAVFAVSILGFTATASANKAVGSWRSTSVRCMKGSVSKPPTMSATVNLNIQTTSYTAQGKVGGFSCSFGGPLTARGTNISFKVGNSACPIADYLKNGFTGYQNGNRMSVRLPASIADLLCEEQGGTIVVELAR